MDKASARRLVEQTFRSSFDRGRFSTFVREILNRYEERTTQFTKGSIPDAFKPHVKSAERLGIYKTPDGEIVDLLVVRLEADTKLARARTALRNFGAYLLNRDGADAALIAFVSPDDKTWRFSYVRLDLVTAATASGKVAIQKELTPARRLSFLVGEGESCHTAQSRFLSLLTTTTAQPSLADVEAAFNVEAVTEEFFEEYKELFLRTKESLDALCAKDKALKNELASRDVSTVDLAKKLLAQIVFLYFIQKKGWLGVTKSAAWGSGPTNFLRRLYKGEYARFDNFFDEVLEPLFYDSLASDRGDDAWDKRLGCRIPFLNGGLFEPLHGYDWKTTRILLPNTLFSNDEKNAVGDVGTGILDVFDRYNFTVNEAEPLEQEVAIDPEMLGKVFENLLEVDERRSTGSFYTPREIVHYMCQESLITYLDRELNGSKSRISRGDLELFIRAGEQASQYEAARKEGTSSYARLLPKAVENEAESLDEALARVAVCDPAIGSGAFPVGMMTEIVRARTALNPYLANDVQRTPYAFKRHAIQASLYGVDIEPSAVEIAKLRLWLSLVVDEESAASINPLPNLDYKIVVGNSLLGVAKNLFNANFFSELEELKPRFFDETNRERKHALKDRIDALISELTNGRSAFDFEIYFSEVMDPKRRGGFDIVIGNPPYVRIQTLVQSAPAQAEQLKKRYATIAKGNYDLYIVFVARGLSVLHKRGNLAFILPHKFFNAGYGRGIRTLIAKGQHLRHVVHFGDQQIFPGATTYVCLLFLSTEPQGEVRFVQVRDVQNWLATKRGDDRALPSAVVTGDDWSFSAGRGADLFERLKRSATKVGDVCETIAQGIRTSANEVYVLNVISAKGDTLTAYSKHLDREVEIDASSVLQFLRGREIKSYSIQSSGKIVLMPYEEVNGRMVLVAAAAFAKRWPNTWAYLRANREYLEDREQGRMRGSGWYGFGRPQNLDVMVKTKILVPDIADRASFAIDETGNYAFTSGYGITVKPTSGVSLKYLLGLLNSRVLEYCWKEMSTPIRGGYYRYFAQFIEQLPLVIAPGPVQKRVEDLADQIATARSAGFEDEASGLEESLDRIVYELYGLSADEQDFVHESTRREA